MCYFIFNIKINNLIKIIGLTFTNSLLSFYSLKKTNHVSQNGHFLLVKPVDKFFIFYFGYAKQLTFNQNNKANKHNKIRMHLGKYLGYKKIIYAIIMAI